MSQPPQPPPTPVALIGKLALFSFLFPGHVSAGRKGLPLPVNLSPPPHSSGKHCQEPKVNALLLAPLSNSRCSSSGGGGRRRGFNRAGRATADISVPFTERSALPPSTGESPICSPLFPLPRVLMRSASFGQVTAGSGGFHADELAFLYSHCAGVSLVVPALMNGQIGFCCGWALFTRPSTSARNPVECQCAKSLFKK